MSKMIQKIRKKSEFQGFYKKDKKSTERSYQHQSRCRIQFQICSVGFQNILLIIGLFSKEV